MTILIKGMEMPPKGQGRMFLYDDNTAIWLNLDTGERIAYEVIPVPTPHGRLIDADAMVGDDNEAYKPAQLALVGAGSGADAMRMVYEVVHKNLQMFIADAPTVIEAEEAE